MGSKAQIVGLQRAIELNGLQVLVLEEEEGGGTGRQREEDGHVRFMSVEGLEAGGDLV